MVLFEENENLTRTDEYHVVDLLTPYRNDFWRHSEWLVRLWIEYALIHLAGAEEEILRQTFFKNMRFAK